MPIFVWIPDFDQAIESHILSARGSAAHPVSLAFEYPGFQR